MIDRENRDKFVSILDDYLSGKIKTFTFDDRRAALNMDDKTVRHIAHLTWFHHDDLIDHRVHLTRQEWNYFQRLRLILKSDAEIVGRRIWNLTIQNAAFFVGLTLLFLMFCHDGLGWKFWALNAAIGVFFVSYLQLATSKQKQPPSLAPEFIPPIEMVPFDSFAVMRAVYFSVPDFQKVPYPRTMDLTPYRSKLKVRFMILPWLVYWPLLALLAILTLRVKKYTVRLPCTPTV